MVELLKVRVDPVPLTAEARQERMGQLVSQLGTADILAYIEEARRRASVTVNPKAFE